MVRSQNGRKIVLTADRTLMSEYQGHVFLGFSACISRGVIPDRLYFNLFCPSVGAADDGSIKFAPYGTRKIESALLENGFDQDDIIIAHPDHLDRVVGPNTRVVGITEMDPLGLGPATSVFTQLFGGEAYMAVKFREVLNHPAIRKHRPRIVVGGPGAWQIDEDTRQKLGIDCVVLDEGEKIVGPLFERAIRGEQIPSFVEGEVVDGEEIPLIRGPTANGVVEIARGCGRGCDFCVPTLQRYRCLPIEHILKEVEVNLRAGRETLLHAEDVLRYGARGLEVNREAVKDLFKSVKNYPGVENVGISHFALSTVASAPDLIEDLSDILGVGERSHFVSGQTGVETGSPELMQDHMVGKCKPFKPEEWPDVVQKSFQILSDNNWVPLSTVIIGLPGETDREAEKTTELVESLRPFKSLIVPLFFVSIGGLKDRSSSFKLDQITPGQTETLLRCWEHNFEWIPRIFDDWYQTGFKNRIAEKGLKLMISYGIKQGRELIRLCENDYDRDIQSMIRDLRSGKINVTPLPARLLRPFL